MTTTDELQLRPFLSGIADAIREVEESEEDINAQEFVERIKALSGGGAEVSIIEYTPTSSGRLYTNRTWEHCLTQEPNLIMLVTDFGGIPTQTSTTNQLWMIFAINKPEITYPIVLTQGSGGGNNIGLLNPFATCWTVDETTITANQFNMNKDTIIKERTYYIICTTI